MGTATARLSRVSLSTPGGRPLFSELELRMGCERVAVVGRNGVGKTSLLRLLAGELAPDRGERRVERALRFVPQFSHDPSGDFPVRPISFAPEAFARECELAGLEDGRDLARPRSGGERRKLQLIAAKLDDSALLLLDEPTDELDERGRAWLRSWLPHWRGGALVVTHDRALLSCFREFFWVSEIGCQRFSGSFAEFESARDRRQRQAELRFVRRLNALERSERHHEQVCRRRRRKRNVGRIHEIDRANPRSRLNGRRSYAQVSQARQAEVRNDRIGRVRERAKFERRALEVQLPFDWSTPRDFESRNLDGPHIELEAVTCRVRRRILFEDLHLRVGRERWAITGPNGSGKTMLLRIMLGQVRPDRGRVAPRRGGIVSIARAGENWIGEDSLLELLCVLAGSEDTVAHDRLLETHRFPVALARRPMASLSPGERVRAAAIAAMHRRDRVELLVLDEPTVSLDAFGRTALRDALKRWPGGLVVASHDREFLAQLEVAHQLELDGRGGHRVVEP